MTGIAAFLRRSRRAHVKRAPACALALALLAQAQTPSLAQTTPGAPATAAEAAARSVRNSALDTPLFYQVLIGEIELRQGHAGNAYEVMLDAARRQGAPELFQRATEIALQAQAADQALAAVKAWRKTLPDSLEPLRWQTQILLATGRGAEVREPLTAWLQRTPGAEQPALVAALPQLLARLNKPELALEIGQSLLPDALPAGADAALRSVALVSLGRLQLGAGQVSAALLSAQQAQLLDPQSRAPALLALELPATLPEADALIEQQLQRDDTPVGLRLAYVRRLVVALRYGQAQQQLQQVIARQPTLAEPWLTMGALHIELKQWAQAEQALLRHLALLDAPAQDGAATGPHLNTPPGANSPAGGMGGEASGDAPGRDPRDATAEPAAEPSADAEAEADAEGEADNDADAGGELAQHAAAQRQQALADSRQQAWLLLAQVAEQRGDLAAAEAWLRRIDNPQRALEVQSRRAALLARQGRIAQARALIQAVPERTGEDTRAKLMAEAQLLRDAQQWRDAASLLADALTRTPDDIELLYEQAMVREKLDELTTMETLLRRVIALAPDHAHAHNALGYALADRGLRLDEARDLIRRALQLQPGDPFITDSLGWVEYRMGHLAEAIRLLREAYAARPDTEIAAHLGEVLWADRQHDAARAIWTEARQRDADNAVLRDTLTRLKVRL